MLFLEYPKCTTCKKAKKWLDENQIAYEDRDIKLNNPTAEEIKHFHEISGLPLKKFFNTSGNLYKEMISYQLDLKKNNGKKSLKDKIIWKSNFSWDSLI